MITIYEEPIGKTLEGLEDKVLNTLICGGIVNPYGPTLTAIGIEGPVAPERRTTIFGVTLNPFSQVVVEIGEVEFGDEWQPIWGLQPLLEQYPSDCPSLVIPSAYLDQEDSVELYAGLLLRFPESKRLLQEVKAHLGDPWTRVKEESERAMREAGKMVKRFPEMVTGQPMSEERMREYQEAQSEVESEGARATPDEARELSRLLLSAAHMLPEIRAFMFGWKGAIDFQRTKGDPQNAEAAMPLDEFERLFAQLTRGCRFPTVDA